MYSIDAVGNRVEWDGNRFTPVYIPLNDFMTHKILNNKVIALYVDDVRHDSTTWISDY